LSDGEIYHNDRCVIRSESDNSGYAIGIELLLERFAMRVLSRTYFGILIVGIVWADLAQLAAAEADLPIAPSEIIQLFNGNDLTGWSTWLVDTKSEDPRGVYSVHERAIRISGDGFGYLSTARAYRDYRLVADVKWGTRNFSTRKGMARDSGIFLHSAGPEGNSYDCGWGSRHSNSGSDVSNGAYKAAIECQVMEAGFGDLLLIHGRYSDGRHVPVRATVRATERRVAGDYAKYQFDPNAKPLSLTAGAVAWRSKGASWQDVPGFRGHDDVDSPYGQWTRIECICDGDQISILINGKHVNHARDVFPSAGKILLQCEGTEVFFRRIELHPLESSPN
jgi:hypothetical protein